MNEAGRDRVNGARMSHAEAERLISARLDAPLDPAQNRVLLAHLATCDSCRAFANRMEQMSTELRALPVLPASPLVSRQVRARIMQPPSPWSWLSGALFNGRWGAIPAAVAGLALVAAVAVALVLRGSDPNQGASPLAAPSMTNLAMASATSQAALIVSTPPGQANGTILNVTASTTPKFPNVQVTSTPTATATTQPTATATPQPTATATVPPTETVVAPLVALNTATATPSPTKTATAVPTKATIQPTATATNTAQATAIAKPAETATIEATSTPGETATPEPTQTTTAEPTRTATRKATATAQPTETDTPAPTATAQPTETATPESTATAEPTQTATVEATSVEPTIAAAIAPAQAPPETATAQPAKPPKPTETPTATRTETAAPASPVVATIETPAKTVTARPTKTPRPAKTPTEPAAPPTIAPQGGQSAAVIETQAPSDAANGSTDGNSSAGQTSPGQSNTSPAIESVGGNASGASSATESPTDSAVIAAINPTETPKSSRKKPSAKETSTAAPASAAFANSQLLAQFGSAIQPGAIVRANPDAGLFVVADSAGCTIYDFSGAAVGSVPGGAEPVWTLYGTALLVSAPANGSQTATIWLTKSQSSFPINAPSDRAYVDHPAGADANAFYFVRSFTDGSGIEVHRTLFTDNSDTAIWSGSGQLSGQPVVTDAGVIFAAGGSFYAVSAAGDETKLGGDSYGKVEAPLRSPAGGGFAFVSGNSLIASPAGQPSSGAVIPYSSSAGGGFAYSADGSEIAAAADGTLSLYQASGALAGKASSGGTVTVVAWRSDGIVVIVNNGTPELRLIAAGDVTSGNG